MSFKECWSCDYYRNSGGKKYFFPKYFIMGKKMRMLYWLRKCHYSKGIFRFINKLFLFFYKNWNNNEISYKTVIGKGLYLGHSGGRYINKDAVIGNNCNINHNVTIGQENRGSRKGCPNIGSNVWIGCNSTIVGNIKIGDNVLIAPNCFINFDVPDNSIVVNGKIVRQENPTKNYINNVV